MTENTLLDDIINKLSKLPGSRDFTASVLVSQPRKSSASLFPYAPEIHKTEVYLQDVFLLVAEKPHQSVILQRNKDKLEENTENSNATNTTAPNANENESKSTSVDVYVSAVEAVLYIFPATRSLIVYISKVDSTGQGKRPSPTRALLLAFVEHLRNRWFVEWNIWIKLFARAQGQYLFPASVEFSGKKVLSDIGLVKWWRSVLDEVASLTTEGVEGAEIKGKSRTRFERFIIIPGLSPQEISYTLKIPLSPTTTGWTIGNPYARASVSYPLGVKPPCSISQLIPYFPDDPKARLIDEIANTTTKADATISSSVPKKRRKLEDGGEVAVDTNGVKEKKHDEEGEEKEEGGKDAEGEEKVDYVRTVSVEEFWERMDGRQECRLGTVAFFTAHLYSETTGDQPMDTDASSTGTGPPQRAEITVATLRKIESLLNGYDFGTIEKARKSTELLQTSIRNLPNGYIFLTTRIPGWSATEGATEHITEHITEAPKDDEKNGKHEEKHEEKEVNTDEILTKYITRTISVNNPEYVPQSNQSKAAESQPVTVLAVRKKKKQKPAVG